ncbi:MAG: TIGR02757 family protein [Bacteroidetes bacterium]|nr:TIGR02757 family protein [Bacteroidota bacterium]
MKDHLKDVKELLDEKYFQFNNTSFIETDPISIPHQFSKKEDIEIASLLVATIAWGQRTSIINNGHKLMRLMNDEPHDFILNFSKKDALRFEGFVHRTFNSTDCVFFLNSLKHIYKKHGGLEAAFSTDFSSKETDVKNAITNFRALFLNTEHQSRSEKHISNPSAKSSAKRLCMFLRWMVRKDKNGVDFGIWKSIKPAQLCLPLDLHTGNVSRKLGLLNRTQNDWQAVEEITYVLRNFDRNDPIKYDFSLFGLGAFEGFR